MSKPPAPAPGVIPKNTITPEKKGPYAGDLQFWRAILQVLNKDIMHHCYMLRRFRSGYAFDIELVSDVHIRSHFGLESGDQVLLTVIGENRGRYSYGSTPSLFAYKQRWGANRILGPIWRYGYGRDGSAS